MTSKKITNGRHAFQPPNRAPRGGEVSPSISSPPAPLRPPFCFHLKKRPRLLAANLEPRGHRNGHHLWPWPSMTAPWQWKMHEDGRWENQKEKPCESSNQENRFFFRKNIWMRQENRRPFKERNMRIFRFGTSACGGRTFVTWAEASEPSVTAERQCLF